MKRFLTAGLSAIALSIFIFSCSGVGGEELTPEQQEIAVRAMLESTSFSSTYVTQALSGAESRPVLANEKGVAIDSNGSTLDYKASYLCGATVTVTVLMEAHLVDLTSPVALRLGSESAGFTQCTAVINGHYELKYESKVSATTGSGTGIFRLANSDTDGLSLKVTRDDTGEVVFNQPVFLLFEMTSSLNNDAVAVDYSCKINGEKYTADWMNDWKYNF